MRQVGPRRSLWVRVGLLIVIGVTAGLLNRVGSRQPPRATDLELRFRTEWEIGPELSRDSRSIALSRTTSAVAVDGSTLAISQPLSGTILLVSHEGVVVGAAGGVGDGPGHFRGLTRIGLTETGAIWAYDRTSRRITFLTSGGALLRTQRAPDAPSEPYLPLAPLQVGDEGHMSAEEDTPLSLWHRGAVSTRRVFGFDSDGSPVELARADLDDWAIAFPPEVVTGPTLLGRRQIIDATLAQGCSQNRSTLIAERGDGRAIRLRSISVKGDTLWRLEYRRPPLPVPQSVKDANLSSMVRFGVESGHFTSESAARRAAGLTLATPGWWPTAQEIVPPACPPFIWLRLGEDSTGGNVYERVDVASRDVKRAVVPSTIRIVWAGDRIIGTRQDDLGQTYILGMSIH